MSPIVTSQAYSMMARIGGIFNEYSFPSDFMSTNDATRPKVLKFETKQLGPIYLAYICHVPGAHRCEDRSGYFLDEPSQRLGSYMCKKRPRSKIKSSLWNSEAKIR